MRGALGCGSSEAGTDLPTGCRPFASFRHRTTPNRTQKIHLTNPPTEAVSSARTRAAPKSQTPTVPRHPQEKLRCYRASSPSKRDRGSRLRCGRKLTDGSRAQHLIAILSVIMERLRPLGPILLGLLESF